MKLQLMKKIFSLLLITLVIACSQSVTLEETKEEKKKEIKKKEKRVLYVKLADTQQRFTNDLEYDYGEQMKWVSDSKEIVYTEHGRLIKTENFAKGNLLFSYSNLKDPLAVGLTKEKNSKTWSRLVDWSTSQMGMNLDSTFSYVGEEKVKIPSKVLSVKTHLYHEKVSVTSLNVSYINKYWISKKSGEVVKSEQYFNPKQRTLTLYMVPK